MTISSERVHITLRTSALGHSPIYTNLERFLTHSASPDMWEKTGVEFITHTSQKISGKAILTVILVTDGVGEGTLGMVTTFCHHD